MGEPRSEVNQKQSQKSLALAKLLKHQKFFLTLEEMPFLTKFTHFKDDNPDSS